MNFSICCYFAVFSHVLHWSSFFLLPRAEVWSTSGPQCWDRVTVKYTSPGTAGELVGVCVSAGKAGLVGGELHIGYF